jgi:hypothetical protein
VGFSAVLSELHRSARSDGVSGFISDYDDSHKALRNHIRAILSENTFLDRRDEFEALIRADKPLPKDVFEVVGRLGLFRVIVGPPWTVPNMAGIPDLPMGIKPENWNMFHEAGILCFGIRLIC